MFEARGLRVTMTSSLFDTATATAVWGYYTGDRRTYAAVCGDHKGAFGAYSTRAFQCGEAADDPDKPVRWGLQACSVMPPASVIRTAPDTSNPDQTIRYLDASKLVNCQTPFGSGGAHSDFNRLEMGRFLWNEIVSTSPIQGEL